MPEYYGIVRSRSAASARPMMLVRAAFGRSRYERRTNTASTKPASRKSVLREVATIGIDVAKTTVHFVGLDATGQVLTHGQYSKGKLVEITATMGPCRIGMEACCGAVAPTTLGRKLLGQGHDVRLMPPKYVKPFVKRDKSRVSQCTSS